MKNNLRLPLLSLSLVSILVCLGAVASVFLLSVDATTVAEKMQSALTLGLPFAVVFTIALWLGAGIDHLLARIQNKSTRVMASIATYVIAPFMLCIALPALAIFLFTGALFPEKGWQELPPLPEPVQEVVAAGDSSVYVQASSGQTYYCWWQSALEDCWQNAEPRSEFVIQNSLGDVTETQETPDSNPPRGSVVDLRGIHYFDMGIEVRVFYAVQNDGSVWVLESGADDYETGFATGLFATIAFIPAVSGLLIIYLGAGISALARRAARSSASEA